MPAKPATKTATKPADPFTEAREIDAVLDKINAGEATTVEQVIELHSLGWDQKRIGREARRLAAIRREQARALTKAERDQRKAKAEQAEKTVAREVPELERVIEEAREKIGELVGKAHQARAVADELEAAVAEIRVLSHLPEAVQEAHKSATMNSVNPIDAEINELEGKIRQARGLANMDTRDQVHIGIIGTIAKRFVVRDPQNRRMAVDEAAWRGYAEEQQKPIPKWEREIVKLREEREAAQAFADGILNFYVN